MFLVSVADDYQLHIASFQIHPNTFLPLVLIDFVIVHVAMLFISLRNNSVRTVNQRHVIKIVCIGIQSYIMFVLD